MAELGQLAVEGCCQCFDRSARKLVVAAEAGDIIATGCAEGGASAPVPRSAWLRCDRTVLALPGITDVLFAREDILRHWPAENTSGSNENPPTGAGPRKVATREDLERFCAHLASNKTAVREITASFIAAEWSSNGWERKGSIDARPTVQALQKLYGEATGRAGNVGRPSKGA